MVAQAIIWVIGSRPPRAVSELIAGCPVYRQLNRSQQLQGTGLDGPCISLSTATGRAKPYQQSLTVTILDRKKKKKAVKSVPSLGSSERPYFCFRAKQDHCDGQEGIPSQLKWL